MSGKLLPIQPMSAELRQDIQVTLKAAWSGKPGEQGEQRQDAVACEGRCSQPRVHRLSVRPGTACMERDTKASFMAPLVEASAEERCMLTEPLHCTRETNLASVVVALVIGEVGQADHDRSFGRAELDSSGCRDGPGPCHAHGHGHHAAEMWRRDFRSVRR